MKKVIVTTFNSEYLFSFASLLLSIKQNSPSLIGQVDFLCYTDDVSEQQKALIRSIHKDIKFRDLDEVNKLPAEILSDNLVNYARWGRYVLVKLLCFDLLNYYDKVLFLDTDMIVRKDISNIFTYTHIAWRKALVWSGKKEFGFLFPKEDKIIGCSGGCLLFSSELRKFKISNEIFRNAYENINEVKRGGIEEKLLTYIAYRYCIPVSELPVEYNCPLMSKCIDEANIIHFLDNTDNHKPWQNNLILSLFPDFLNNIKTWKSLGGDVPFMNPSFSSFHDRYVYIRNMKRICDVMSILAVGLKTISCVRYNLDPCFINLDIAHKYFTSSIKITIRGNFKDEVTFTIKKVGSKKWVFKRKISRFLKRAFEHEGFKVLANLDSNNIVVSTHLTKRDYGNKLKKICHIYSGALKSSKFKFYLMFNLL